MPFTVTTGYWRREMDPTEGWVFATTTDDFQTREQAEAFIARQQALDALLKTRASLTRSGPGEYSISERVGEAA